MSTEKLAALLVENFNPENTAGVCEVFGFDIENVGEFHININDSVIELGDGPADEANVVLTMSEETFRGLANGDVDGMQAFMEGKLRADGDLMLATKLGEYFTL